MESSKYQSLISELEQHAETICQSAVAEVKQSHGEDAFVKKIMGDDRGIIHHSVPGNKFPGYFVPSRRDSDYCPVGTARNRPAIHCRVVRKIMGMLAGAV